MFHKGDRVVIVKDVINEKNVGIKGTVITGEEASGGDQIAVAFDDPLGNTRVLFSERNINRAENFSMMVKKIQSTKNNYW